MKLEANDLLNYHCPRWNELPEIELYADQVICILQNNLEIFNKADENPIITQSMINNYVKKGFLMPPTKKKYNRTHLAYLFVICILKRLMNISEISDSIQIMQKIYTTENGYNFFCEELESAIKTVFSMTEQKPKTFVESASREDITLRAMLSAFANCILVDRLILLRKNGNKNLD